MTAYEPIERHYFNAVQPTEPAPTQSTRMATTHNLVKIHQHFTAAVD